MSAISKRDDPRVVRTRAAVVDAARTLFLRQGYAGTTMHDIADMAGITKRTVYNNYADKDVLFTQIVVDVISYADAFAIGLRETFATGFSRENLHAGFHELGRELTLSIVRPEVVALRRLLIGEARVFPELAKHYFERAPGQVIDALAAGLARMSRAGLLRISDARVAGAQFAYLVAGEPLDRAMLTGIVPSKAHLVSCAREGVETFLARWCDDPDLGSSVGRKAHRQAPRARSG